VTTLNFQKVDPAGNPILDLNGEQRTQTEKVVRRMLGSAVRFSSDFSGNPREYECIY